MALSRLFWVDMLLVGSAINIACSMAALFLLALKLPTGLPLLVHFAPFPYNVFLFTAVWRTARHSNDAHAHGMRIGALAWLIAATLV